MTKGADDEVKIETSPDNLMKYPLVQRLLERMRLSKSNLHPPFAILTQKTQMQPIRSWLLESAFQRVLVLTVKYYVEERGVAAHVSRFHA